MRRPANVDDCESQRGAETIPWGLAISGREQLRKMALTVTILKEDAETLLDKEIGVEDDQAE